jgi:hypothetical protein
MNSKPLFGALALLTGSVLLPGCGGESSQSAAAMPQPQTQVLDTMQVLAIARVRSETSDPVPVVDGALRVADANDDSSDPLPVG